MDCDDFVGSCRIYRIGTSSFLVIDTPTSSISFLKEFYGTNIKGYIEIEQKEKLEKYQKFTVKTKKYE